MAKTAMVTGASGGIGLEFAERLAKDGYSVTVVARSKGKLEALAAKLPGSGHRVLEADLSVPADSTKVADDVRASKYDLLVNNAGIGVYGRFEAMPLAQTQAMLRLNIDSVVELSYAYLQGAKSGDALMNVASTLALLSFPGATAYAASKYFVMSFSEGLWFENKDRGIYVAGLLPGVTKTNFHEAAGGTKDTTPPDSLSQSAAGVVDAGMAALRSRSSPTVLTSFMNKAMVFMSTRAMPRKSMISFMGGQSGALKTPPPALPPGSGQSAAKQ